MSEAAQSSSSSLQSAEERLLQFFDFEKERSKRVRNKVFTLDRIQQALSVLGHPQKKFRIVHIAGTKGKGSTVEYLYRLINESTSLKMGLFTSPHLISVHERIRIGQHPIAENDLNVLIDEIFGLQKQFEKSLTYFEVLLLMSLLHFQKEGVELVLLETGLGGRLDATNAVQADLSILTRIDYDHTEVLGEDLKKIAWEKACIMKGNDAIALQQAEEVNQVIEKTARERQSHLSWVKPQEDWDPGRENASLALAAAHWLLPEIEDWPQVQELMVTPIQGRLQTLQFKGQAFLLDAAHNKVSMQALVSCLRKMNKPCSLCVSFSRHRSAEELLRELISISRDLTFCPLPGGRPGYSTDEMKEVLDHMSIEATLKVTCLDDSGDALKHWIEQPFDGIKVATGSFYLVGEVMKQMEHMQRSLN